MQTETVDTARREMLIETFHDFLEEIGIVLREGEVPEGSFLPGVTIVMGEVVYDKNKLLYPGDILHEAGHVALLEPAERSVLSGNVAEADKGKAGYEIGVLLWTWAAIQKTGIPPEVVFHPDGYKDESDWLIENFQSRKHIGLPLLVWMKMARNANEPGGFPEMVNWLRP
ncbi:MAG TPA: hypothetical protein VK826_07380 [Bacteroidia bacterium]|nr:hypothetical protein [Bacteroidia bacterium]